MSVPIRVRMTAWYVALLGLILAAVGTFLVLRLQADLVASVDAGLGPAAEQIALGYHAEGPPELPDISATVLSGEAVASQVLDPAGRVVAAFGGTVAATPMLHGGELRRASAGDALARTATLHGRRFRLAARRTTRRGAPRVVVAAEATGAIDRSVHRLLMLLLVAGPVALAATAAGGWWLARRSLRPIDRLSTQAGEIGMDRLAERLPVAATGDEVGRLAATLNVMLDRIEAGVDEQRRIVADASHELRTPLAAMRAEIDVSLRADDLDAQAAAVLRSTREEVDRLSHTVDGLLLLASADEGALAGRRRALDLADVAREAAGRLGGLARSREVTVALDLEPAPVHGDRTRLGTAVANLVSNAIEFSPAGGTVAVATAARAREVLLRVGDDGPGVPAAARERVFDRFYRVDASRARATGGSGIGLSLVREIAAAHGGRVWNEPGPLGGSVFTLALPASEPAVGDDGRSRWHPSARERMQRRSASTKHPG